MPVKCHMSQHNSPNVLRHLSQATFTDSLASRLRSRIHRQRRGNQAVFVFWRSGILRLYCLIPVLQSHPERRLQHLRWCPARRLCRNSLERTRCHHDVLSTRRHEGSLHLLVLDDLQSRWRYRKSGTFSAFHNSDTSC